MWHAIRRRCAVRLASSFASAAAVATASSAALAEPAAAAAAPGILLDQSPGRRPFEDPELKQALPERALRQQRLLQYLGEVRPRLQQAIDLGGDAARAAVSALQQEVAAKQEAVLFDALPGERRRYLLQHGCAAWTEAALAEVASHSPLIELGAGAGQWARALGAGAERSRHLQDTPKDVSEACRSGAVGADVAAYDDGSEVPQAGREMRAEASLIGQPLLVPHGFRRCVRCRPSWCGEASDEEVGGSLTAPGGTRKRFPSQVASRCSARPRRAAAARCCSCTLRPVRWRTRCRASHSIRSLRSRRD